MTAGVPERRVPAGHRIEIRCDEKHPQPGDRPPRRPLLATAESNDSGPPWSLFGVGVVAQIKSGDEWLVPADAIAAWTSGQGGVPERLRWAVGCRVCRRSVIARDEFHLFDAFDNAAAVDGRKRLILDELREHLEGVNSHLSANSQDRMGHTDQTGR